MTESQQKEITEVTVDARIRGLDKVEPWNKSLWKFAANLVAFLPTYRDSREGRKNKKRIQIMLFVGGLILMIIGGTAEEWWLFWILLGLGIAASSSLVPVEDMKMRSWRSTLKKKQKPRQKTRWQKGRVEFDGRYVAVYAGDERVRRVRVDRDKHDIELRSYDDRPCLGVLPLGAKKSESIWLCATEPVDIAVDINESIEADKVGRPARVAPNDWETLWEALRQTH